jgi:hypothetical protein
VPIGAPKRWHLWHGNTIKGLELIHDLDWDVDLHHLESSTKYEKIKPLIRYISELESYIRQNAHLIVDYSERYRYGEAISTGFVESTVNYVVAKRFTKKPGHVGSKCNGAKRERNKCWWCGQKY